MVEPRGLAWRLLNAMGASTLSRRMSRDRLLIVCYHGITNDETSSDWLLHPVTCFEREIAFLVRHYEVLPVDEALARLYGPGLNRPTASITFDDGYANNLSVALPVLQRFRAPATLYLTTGLIETGGYLWTTVLQHSVQQSDRPGLQVGDDRVDGPLGTTPRERARRGGALKELLKGFAADEREELTAKIVSQLGQADGLDPFRLLTPDEVSNLDSSGLVTFGGHTRTHPILSELPDPALESEIGGSIDDLRCLRHISNTFAYPNGRPRDYDSRAVEILKGHGIAAGLSTRPWLHNREHDPFHSRRVLVGGGMRFDDFVAATSGLKEAIRR